MMKGRERGRERGERGLDEDGLAQF